MAAPTVTAIDIASGPAGTLVTLTGTNFDETVTSVAFGAYDAGSNYTVLDETYLSVYVPEGTGSSLNVVVTNGDGSGTLTSGWTYATYEGGPGGGGGSAPTMDYIDPHTSAYYDGRGGDEVTIYGDEFTTTYAVWFGTVQASFQVDSDTQITCWAPPGAGEVDVSVTNAYGTSSEPDPETDNDFTYPTDGQPTITAEITPNTGVAGTLVTIVGTNFASATVVTFGEYNAEFKITSDTSIQAIAPEGPAAGSTVAVMVTNAYGTTPDPGAWNNFEYTASVGPETTATYMYGAEGPYPLEPNGYTGWKGGTCTVTLSAVDTGGPGISVTFYRVDHGTIIQYYAAFNLTTEGSHEVEYWSVSTNGRVEPGKTGWVNIVLAPSTPTGFSATAIHGGVLLAWTAVTNTSATPIRYCVYVDTVNPPLVKVATISATTYTHSITQTDGARYYAVTAMNVIGTESAKTTAQQITALATVAEEFVDGIIDMAAFATGIVPPQVVDTLPALPDADYPVGATVFLTTDKRLYRNLGGGPNTNAGTNKGTWYDRSASGNDGTLNGFAYTEQSGWDGTGYGGDLYNLAFDGTGDYVTLASAVTAPEDRQCTWEAWVKPESQTGYVIYDGLYAGTRYFHITITSSGGAGTARAYCMYKDSIGTNAFIVQPGGNLYDNAWHHIAATLNGTVMTLYVDGFSAGTATITEGTWTADRTTIGRDEDASPSLYYKGWLAGVRCHSSCLAAAEIYRHYSMGPTGTDYNTSNIVLDLTAKYALESNVWVPLVDGGESAGTIMGNAIIGNSITAGSIAAAAIGADEIAAGVIAAKHILIGNFENLIPNPLSEWDHTGKDTTPTSVDLDFRGVQSSLGSPMPSGTHSRYMAGGGTGVNTYMVITPRIPCKEDEEYYFECMARLYTASNEAYVKARAYDSTGTEVTITSGATTDAIDDTTWTEYKIHNTTPENWFTIPATAVAFEIVFFTSTLAVNNYVLVDEMFLRAKIEGTLVVDGTIETRHLDAESVTSEKIEASVSLTSPTITGGTIKTAASGQRIQLSSATANTIDFWCNHANEITQAKIYSDDDGNYGYIYMSAPVLYSGAFATVACRTGNTGASDSNIFIGANGITLWDGSSTYPQLTVSATDDKIVLSAAVDAKVYVGETISSQVMTHVVGALSVSGRVFPYSDWSSGTSDDGIWIQNSSSGREDEKLKLYYDSANNRLVVRLDGDTYALINADSYSGW